MIEMDVIDPLASEFRTSLDPKFDSDNETTRFCLLLTANLCTNAQNHGAILEKTLGKSCFCTSSNEFFIFHGEANFIVGVHLQTRL